MAVSLEDVQNQVPTLHVSLSRVGVTNVEKVIRINAGGSETLYSAKLDCFVDLGPRRDAGPAHRREGARPAGRAARGSAPRRPLPGAQAGAAQRHPDAGDL